MKDKKEFIYCFQLSKKIIFEVSFYTLSTNPTPHFSTSAYEFNQPKTDYSRGGQAQEELLPHHRKAFNFWKKWDAKHLHNLTDAEYAELVCDIEILKDFYNYIFLDCSQFVKPYDANIGFYRIKDLSMQKLKNKDKENK